MKPVVILSVLIAGALLAGCHGVPTSEERQARRDFKAVAAQYPPDQTPETGPLRLPELTPDSSLSNYLAYALLNSPAVKAAFYDWSASVENITVSRSLPDPQLTFQAFIEHALTSLMPGFVWNFPGPGKLRVRAQMATAQSDGKYFTFESAMLQAAYDLKKAYYNLGLLDEQLRINRESLALLDTLDQALRARNATGQGTLSQVLRVQTDRDRLRTEIENLADSRHSALAQFKAALGLTPAQPDPPAPAHFETSPENPDADELWRLALAHNPQLKGMEADVRAAEAGIAVAYKERTPDFSAGLSAEVYSPPFFWPQAGMTLPVWRDKLAAEIAQAKAAELAAANRLQAAQINLAVTFAAQVFACRETGRTLTLIEDQLMPRARQSLEIARVGYRAGSVDFASVTDAERMQLDLQLSAAEARTAHEIALAELSILVSGVPPPGAAILSNNR
jgi:outer membrane protein TolC